MNIIPHWYRSSYTPLTCFLRPWAELFRLIIVIRRKLYAKGFLKTTRFNVPVVIVGNITVGGTGKTPFVIWLAAYLTAHGYTPGIVTRGVGGRYGRWPKVVTASSEPTEVGDEALVLACRCRAPIVVGKNRVAAVKTLLKHFNCDVIISDDGLQHYGLARDIEIVIIDGVRQFGNGLLLPAGPLREPVSRLATVDFTLTNQQLTENAYTMQLIAQSVLSAVTGRYRQHKSLADFSGQTVHAVAAIGHPQRFFTLLQQAGINVIPHCFPDHYHYQPNDIIFEDDLPIFMTEKDVVKCRRFVNARHWYLPVDAVVSEVFKTALLAKLALTEVSNANFMH